MHKLTSEEISTSLMNIADWQLSDDKKTIYKVFIMRDFIAAISLINRIAEIAANDNHHPDIHLTDYRQLRVELTTYDAGGLTLSDFSQAGKIDHLPMELKR